MEKPVLNKANLQKVIDLLKAEAYHFNMRYVAAEKRHDNLQSNISEPITCNTYLCIAGTVEIAMTGKGNNNFYINQHEEWLGIDSDILDLIYRPDSYHRIGDAVSEGLQRKVAIRVLEEVLHGHRPSSRWLIKYTEAATQ